MITWLMLACSAGEDTDKTGDPIGTGTTEECSSGNAPVVTGFTVSEGDTLTNEDGEEQPSILFTVEFEDEDADINEVEMNLWWDAEIDGSVDTASADGVSFDKTQLEEGECTVDLGSLGAAWGVVGDPLEFETEYDFAVTIVDMAGIESEPAFATGTTPAEL